MENKKLYIGLGLLAAAGLGIYLYRKNKAESTETETKANAIGRRKLSNQIFLTSRVPSSMVATSIAPIRKNSTPIPLAVPTPTHRYCCVQWDEYGRCRKEELVHILTPCGSQTPSKTVST